MPAREGKIVYASIYPPDEKWLAKSLEEPVLEAGLPIVDTHFHLSEFEGYRYFLPQFARDINECGHNIEAAVFVECHTGYASEGPEHLRPVGETRFVVDAVRQPVEGLSTKVAPAIVAFADLTLGKQTRETLEAHIAAGEGRLRGIRHRAKWDADPVVRGKYSAAQAHLYLSPKFNEGMRVMAELGLSFDASVYHPQIPDVTALAQAHPDVPVILIHSGSPVGHSSYAGKQEESHANWLASMQQLAACPNAHVKLGGVLMNLANFDFLSAPRPPSSAELADLWRPYIEPCIELFGPERCMVSSNFPVEKAGVGYGTVWNMFKRITAGYSDDEKALIYSGTAKRVYRFE